VGSLLFDDNKKYPTFVGAGISGFSSRTIFLADNLTNLNDVEIKCTTDNATVADQGPML